MRRVSLLSRHGFGLLCYLQGKSIEVDFRATWDPIRVGWGDPTVPGAGYAMIYSGKAVPLCGASSVAEARAENPSEASLWLGLCHILTEGKAF